MGELSLWSRKQTATENSATSLPYPDFKTCGQHSHAENFLKSRIFDTFQKYSYHLSLHSFPEWMSEILLLFFFFLVGGACFLANLAKKTIKEDRTKSPIYLVSCNGDTLP